MQWIGYSLTLLKKRRLDAFDSNANAVRVSDEAQKLAGHDGKPCAYRLQSVVMHKGSSVHAGHYVAFIRKADSWCC